MSKTTITRKELGKPILENNIFVSEDGKWIIHKVIITTIKPAQEFYGKLVNKAKTNFLKQQDKAQIINVQRVS